MAIRRTVPFHFYISALKSTKGVHASQSHQSPACTSDDSFRFQSALACTSVHRAPVRKNGHHNIHPRFPWRWQINNDVVKLTILVQLVITNPDICMLVVSRRHQPKLHREANGLPGIRILVGRKQPVPGTHPQPEIE